MNEERSELSIAFKAGMDARDCDIPLLESALRSLHPESTQYADYIAGWDRRDYELKTQKKDK